MLMNFLKIINLNDNYINNYIISNTNIFRILNFLRNKYIK